ncbi:MAG: amine oxidase [Gammaproteobacteria bacterium]
MTEESIDIRLVQFEQFVQALKRTMQRQYDRNINKDLSQQHWQDLFKRNVTGSLRQAYTESLAQLRQLSFKSAIPGLSNRVLHTFEGFIDEFLQYALQKHRTSCALSNFPSEHNPSRDYIAAVLCEANKDWQSFVEQVGTELA